MQQCSVGCRDYNVLNLKSTVNARKLSEVGASTPNELENSSVTCDAIKRQRYITTPTSITAATLLGIDFQN